MATVTIRPVRPHEAPRVLAVLHAAHAWNLAHGFNFTAATIALDELIPHLSPESFHVADRRGQILGTIEITPWDEPGAWSFHLLAVDPRANGQGIGRALVSFAEAFVAARGGTALVLDTPETHPWLPGFYRRLGYEPAGMTQWEGKHYRSIFLRKTVEKETS